MDEQNTPAKNFFEKNKDLIVRTSLIVVGAVAGITIAGIALNRAAHAELDALEAANEPLEIIIEADSVTINE